MNVKVRWAMVHGTSAVNVKVRWTMVHGASAVTVVVGRVAASEQGGLQ